LKINKKNYRTIWLDPIDNNVVKVIDQRYLPHKFEILDLLTMSDVYNAIEDMAVRGAPLIGATAAWGVYLSAIEALSKNYDVEFIKQQSLNLRNSRPTAINLEWAVNRMLSTVVLHEDLNEMTKALREEAKAICDEDVEESKAIGMSGLKVIKEISMAKPNQPINILTHCNAGWLATIDYGTATSPIYTARDSGIDLHIWVDETRPRNQGSNLTAWELAHEGIKHSIIVDNAGGYLMQQGEVDLIIVGSDRTTKSGDVCNKIGTYLKALAAFDNKVPFYVALPESTFDWNIEDGLKEIPIEIRDEDEIAFISGSIENRVERVKVIPDKSTCLNIAFDVTPSKFITGLITPRGICKADKASIQELYPEHF